jgi:hypothetical protein
LWFTADLWGIEIAFEVLGVDLMPVCTASTFTNILAVAEVQYLADDVHDFRMAQAGPSDDHRCKTIVLYVKTNRFRSLGSVVN